jgi:hypothetical protein
MERKRAIKVVLLFFVFAISSVNAQNAITGSGGNGSGIGGSVSYSVGQTNQGVNSSGSGTSAEGVQQPYEITLTNGIVRADVNTMEMTIGPNPSTDEVRLIIKDLKPGELFVEVNDAKGNNVIFGKLMSNETVFQFGKFATGNYTMNINRKGKVLKTFKIIKK